MKLLRELSKIIMHGITLAATIKNANSLPRRYPAGEIPVLSEGANGAAETNSILKFKEIFAAGGEFRSCKTPGFGDPRSTG